LTIDIFGTSVFRFDSGDATKDVEKYLNCETFTMTPWPVEDVEKVIHPQPFDVGSVMESITTFQNMWFSKIDDCQAFHRVFSFDKKGVYFAVLFEQSNANPFGRKLGDKLITSPTFVSYDVLAEDWCYTNGVDFFNAFVKSAYDVYKSDYKSNK
jgi:hypothetical protein